MVYIKFPLQTFLSELYVYLVDQMHEALAKFLSLEDKTPAPTPLTDSAQLKHFAREAEVNEQFELADKYYKEVRVVYKVYQLPISQGTMRFAIPNPQFCQSRYLLMYIRIEDNCDQHFTNRIVLYCCIILYYCIALY